MIAAAALLLASSLEVCGCDVVQDCEQIRAMQISAKSWPALLRRCAACLSSEEMRKVTEEKNRTASSSFIGMPRMSETVGQALGDRQPLSFYAPGTAPEESSSLPNSVGSWSLSPSFPNVPGPRTWPISESVFLIYAEAESGVKSESPTPVATAFVVSVPTLDHRSRIRFLVTARHIVDPEWAQCPTRNPGSIVVRLNRWTGASAYVHIPLETDHARQYFTSTDGSADIAVLRLDDRVLPNIDSYKLMDTPYSMLPTEEELGAISKGTVAVPSLNRPIVTARLKTQPLSGDRSVAGIDSGTLTSTPVDPVGIQCDPASAAIPLHIWTIDADVAREVSGAPVYTTMIRKGTENETPVLLGVQSVALPGERVAGITPSNALGELIQQVLGRDARRQMDLYEGAFP